MSETPQGWLTVQQVADMAKVTVGYISRLCRDGRLETMKPSGIWLIDRKSALEWMYSDRTRGPKRKDED